MNRVFVQIWSATEYVSTTMWGDETVFGVNFADGRIKGYPKYDPQTGFSTGYRLFARYVRGNTGRGGGSARRSSAHMASAKPPSTPASRGAGEASTQPSKQSM